MATEFNLQQRQNQEQMLSPQQRLSLEMLATPLLELQTKLALLAEQNPMIELSSPGIEVAVGDPISNSLAGEERNGAQDIEQDERDFQTLVETDEWLDSLPMADSGENADRARRREFAFNSITATASAQEQLLEQLRFTEISGKMHAVCEFVIGNIDERGFLTATDKEIAFGAACTEDEAVRAVQIVQTFEPRGIGARSIEEALLIQLAGRNINDPVLEEIIEHCLDDVAHNRLPQLARRLQLTIDELKEKLAVIKSLSFRPGAQLDSTPAQVVIPEFVIKRRGAELVIADNPGVLPQLEITGGYDDILTSKSPADAEARRFLMEKKNEAKQLIRSLSLRQTTLKRITEILASEQFDFFMYGGDTLHPLTMSQVANKLDLHETTVSRALSGKYISTAFGVFEYRHFFSGGYTSSEGEQIAAGSVKERIREMISAEERKKPLSDDKIAQMLKSEGLCVARRTVAKYRESLGILPSNLRRDF